MRRKYLYRLMMFVGVCAFCVSCNGYLEEMPQNKLKPTTTDDYNQLLAKAYITQTVLPYLEILTDDVVYDQANRISWADNGADAYIGAFLWYDDIEVTMGGGDIAFETFYNSIYNTNVVIENIDDATGVVLDEGEVAITRGNVKGEAYALRAFDYFYLVNLYAPYYDPVTCETTPGIPINLRTEAEDKAYMRASLKEVYEQIVSDLKEGIRLMEEYPIANKSKMKFSAIAAKALLARVYLYMNEWDLAIAQAEEVIKENPAIFDLRVKGEDPYVYSDNVISWSGSRDTYSESYVGVKNSNVLFTTGINEYFRILGSNNFLSSFAVSESLLNSYSPGDVRKYYFMRKCKIQQGTPRLLSTKNGCFKEILDANYNLVISSTYGFVRALRTEEMYLILAEAYAHKTDGLSKAVGYLNTLREYKFRVGDYKALRAEDFNQASLLEKIYLERRLEFCFEEHRWFDLRRTTRPAMEHTGLGDEKGSLVK
ncbi:MAG: RagB/SusD family nutrient uptake outer membrane protein, partial [Butyricimonas faecihominis]